jgi:hypothetical protein
VQVLAIGRLEDRMRVLIEDMEETAGAMRTVGLPGQARLVRGWIRRAGEVRGELCEALRAHDLDEELRAVEEARRRRLAEDSGGGG